MDSTVKIICDCMYLNNDVISKYRMIKKNLEEARKE